MSLSTYSRLCLFALLLTFGVVLLGAYVRLSNAGLGCPDWPGCYGRLIVPNENIAQLHSPDIPLEKDKAWKEMAHRYLASSLGLVVILLALFSLKLKLGKLPWFILIWVIFQALLGMWTVTLKLHPFVVMSHLLGGFLSLSLLWVLYLKTRPIPHTVPTVQPVNFVQEKKYILFALILLILQITLGGWTSANYAALACPDFPTCQMKWIPPLDFKSAYGVWHDFGHNYEWGVLHNEARTTIHWMHRVWAFVVFVYLYILGIVLYKKHKMKWGLVLSTLVSFQVLLGISNVIFKLPLPVAVAHNGGAALLLLTLIKIYFKQNSLKTT